MRQILRLYIHHSESPKDSTTTEGIRDWHVNHNGWRNIGYSFVIEADGSIHQGRPIEEAGAHVYGDNQESVGICVAGNFDREEPTVDQIASLITLLAELCAEYNIHASNILGHRDHKGVKKTCPGKNLYSKLNKIRKSVNQRLKRLTWIEQLIAFLIQLLKRREAKTC